MALRDGQVLVREADENQYQLIRGWGMMRWDRSAQMLRGRESADLLNRLAGLPGVGRLPDAIEAERKRLNAIQAAVDAERISEDPEPICEYPVDVSMFKHQIRGANMAMLTLGLVAPGGGVGKQDGGGFGLLFEMGLGKSLTAIAVMGAAWEAGEVTKVLVVAPTSVCSVWPKEIGGYAKFKSEVAVLLGDKQKRIAELGKLAADDSGSLKVAVINYESTWRDGVIDALTEWEPDMVIADESQRIKEPGAKQSKAMHRLGDLAKYRLILSGTPVQNNAVDIFSQYRFLDPGVFGTNFYAFRSRYAVMGGFNKKQIIGYRNMDELVKKEHSIAYRVTKAEALDLPEQTFIRRTVAMDGKARAMYERLKRDSFAELEDGGMVTAPTVLTKLLRLQQFTGGFLQPDGAERPEYVFDGKIKALCDILDDYVLGEGKKLVIFCRFRPEIALISAVLEDRGIRYGAIYGDIKTEERGKLVADFQENPETKVFLAQIDTAGLGITLTAADTCLYYSVNFNYAAYSQSLARIHRIGQRNACTYIHLMAERSVDSQVLDALAKKEDLAKTVVDGWRNFFE